MSSLVPKETEGERGEGLQEKEQKETWRAGEGRKKKVFDGSRIRSKEEVEIKEEKTRLLASDTESAV